jgi:O-antigen/teichoic acid export membrane protein
VNEAVSLRARSAAGDRSRLVRDASGYMAATYISQALAFGIGVVTKGLLGPVDLGIWTLLLAILSFLGLLEFGVIQAANKEIAYALSKGDEEAAERFKRVQFSFVALTGLVGGLGLAGYACLSAQTHSEKMTLGLLAIALVLPLSQLHMGQVTVYWANREFSVTGLLTVFETVLAGTAGLFLVWRLGVAGQVTAFFVILLVKIGVLAQWARANRRLQLRFSWDARTLKHLLKVGVPLQINNLANVLKLSGTVFVISHYLGTQAVGLYSLALSVQNFIYWTPNAFSIVMFPRFQERYAASTDQAAALHSYLVKPVVGLAFFLLPLLISATYFLVPPLINHALPAYKPSIPVLAAMLAGTFFLCLEHMPAQFMMTANRLWQRVTLSMLSLVLLAACLGMAIARDWTLVGFVATLSLANIASFLIAFAYAYWLANGPRSDRWFIPKLIGAYAYLVTVVLTIDHVLAPTTSSWWFDALFALGKWALALVLLMPVFAVAERQLGLMAAIRHLASRKPKPV